MPGVRYGPDISDDAAQIMDFVQGAQARIRQGLKLSRRDQTKYDSYKSVARQIFGVRNSDFDKGKLGDLAEMAKYGGAKSRNKIAKSWRTGGQMKKSVTREFEDRGVPGGRKAGSTGTPKDAWYVGRTRTKKFRELEARAQRRLARNGATFGATNVKPRSTKPDNFLAQVDKLNIAKARSGSSDILNRPRGVTTPRKAGAPIRPALPKSAARAATRARAAEGKREATRLSKAGKGRKTGGRGRK